MSGDQIHHMQISESKSTSAEGRRRWTAERLSRAAPRLFVVRLGAGPALRFGWEIRKFGNFVLSKSEAGFATLLEAEIAGEKVLKNVPTEGSQGPRRS